MKCVLALIFCVAVCSAQESNATENADIDDFDFGSVDLNELVFGYLYEFFTANNTAAQACDANGPWKSNATASSPQAWQNYLGCVANNNSKVELVASYLSELTSKHINGSQVVNGIYSFIVDVQVHHCSLNKLVLKFVDFLHSNGTLDDEWWEGFHAVLDEDDNANARQGLSHDDLCAIGETAIYGLELAKNSTDPEICFSKASLEALQYGLTFVGFHELGCNNEADE